MDGQIIPGEITELLGKWAEGAGESFEELMSLVYQELHNTAQYHFAAESWDHTLQPTALISEAYLRLRDRTGLRFPSRSHFFAYAGHVMRSVLLDYARRKSCVKRGANGVDLPLEDAKHLWNMKVMDHNLFIALNQALDRLSEIDPRKGRFLEQFYFAGLTAEQMAEVANLTPSTVRRELRAAKHWLGYELAKK